MQIPDVSGYEPGQALDVENLFKVGDLIDVAGQSIGKGFQGIDVWVCFCSILQVYSCRSLDLLWMMLWIQRTTIHHNQDPCTDQG